MPVPDPGSGGAARNTVSASRVLIVDDHELLSTTMELALRAQGITAFRPRSLDPDSVRAAAADGPAGLLLLDLDLGSGADGVPVDGMLMAEDLRAEGWIVLILTGTTEKTRIAAAIAAGAVGWISKSAPFPDLVRMIVDAVAGRPVISAQEREHLLDIHRRARTHRRTGRELLGRLTAREREVLNELVAGRRAAVIARDSVVSIATVRSQIRSILTKLEVSSQLEAVALVRSLPGWTDPGGGFGGPLSG
ncbi:two component transcriptional regulator, LuxR family [Marinactinospora thermotolerans DSM 45154]|uniref:Two component transcriptional regulator, LuxR family n=1 Tax=Marinactinospora thermotolerans DSM 45154 TaxID=1122192 RepID=A0A1T4R724_9ACTN|nr:two component transcriptional regulator, LuxR family [Marinactinospora thermotolerans DSM 45154]